MKDVYLDFGGWLKLDANTRMQYIGNNEELLQLQFGSHSQKKIAANISQRILLRLFVIVKTLSLMS